MADSIVTVHVISRGLTAASDRDRLLRSGQGAREVAEAVRERLTAVASGALSGKLVVRVDGSAAAAASGTAAVTAASCTAGDRLIITVPGYPSYALTCVATDDEVTAGAGEYSIETATDDAVGASIETAINGLAGLNQHVVADNTTGSVAITAIHAGTIGNGITLAKDVTTAGAFTLTQPTGGADSGQRPTATITFNTDTNALAADDTIAIGAVTFTWKNGDASGESQIDYANVDATDAASLVTAVNGHSKLEGLVFAESSGGVVTLTWLGEPRLSQLVTIVKAETNSGAMTLSDAAFAPLTTESYGGTVPREFSLGAP